jgi:hypothetical protein
VIDKVTGTLTAPLGELTVTTVRNVPGPKPVGLALNVKKTGGPPGIAEPPPLTVSQLSAAVMEVRVADPAPMFCNPTGWVRTAVLEAVVLNSTRLVVKTNCGGGEDTFKEA